MTKPHTPPAEDIKEEASAPPPFDWTTHPGEHLAEFLEIRGWGAAECAWWAGLHVDEVRGVLDEDRPITQRIAEGLGFATTLPAPMWLRLQAAWDARNLEDA